MAFQAKSFNHAARGRHRYCYRLHPECAIMAAKNRREHKMSWYIACFMDKNGIFQEFGALETPRSLPLYIHLNKCRGLEFTGILNLTMQGAESFTFEGDTYQAVTMNNPEGGGQIVFISDAPIKAKIFENVLTNLNLGLQIFDNQSRLIFLNDTCQRIESLIRENVIGKRLQEVYTVDEDYSTILTTLREHRAVKDRCDFFSNRFGDEVISINSGFPLYLDGHFYGAYGLVMDLEALSNYTAQRDILSRFMQQSDGKGWPRYDIIDRYYVFDDLIGNSENFREAMEVARKVAASDFSVMLLGETGTGKEMFAQSIHSASLRQSGGFVAINCAAIPSSIIESVLFGTVKGAFTGSGNQRGLLDEADGGTLFLDEINSMDFQVQSKLLRVLQEKKFRRVGGLKDLVCDFRVIAAMNEPPLEAIENNRLRQDLFYRLNTVTIEIPPLRERPQDIPLLVEHYLKSPARGPRPRRGLTEAAQAVLMGYDWPGNIRELFHTLDYATAVAEGGLLDVKHFPERLTRRKAVSLPIERKDSLRLGLKEALLDHEKHLIESALKEHNNNISRAAKALKLSRQGLQQRLKKLGLSAGGAEDR
ncbi:hypothetical protein C4J81_18935 (plasmid) [Deltaproteobacteria bacterium Smac51]|nr:hypothetical protein C4J81_18935 [Deltaproteobacteria bacterium Smac51]